ncbi:4'-phosphopantetheinyl transferase family protein [Tropicibacter naphthalenivorans]|uniref:Enterobactin synthase component D n=1 Tax=Tropicibacter naphthalenivorans TaxID=441103 RepID=A0A0N7M0Q0_9RHOB|nr:4'-phosphopantetheinyl transferase superfamily protein [Tropicibacter naphthalenivorans]CUH81081.1 phosphopantetheinyltransferase component of enterobactin synthase multienzyme complex [Tropicibacter naphthalenivorans]SMC97022.1 4'-phosphopantetheinyl transferase EntD (siderophore biosynthesis) [Tropicibacter naphthalenivorans]
MTPDALPPLSEGFLTQPQVRALSGGVLVQGRFDLGRFAPALFETLGITRPPRLSRAVDKRLAEYLAGRAMAAVALDALGLPPAFIDTAESRAPIWPAGLSGSITHARGHCACLLLPAPARAPGLDIEALATDRALDSILHVAVNETEAALLNTAPDLSQAATLTFSAKETLFKALFPTVRSHFGFDCARLCALPARGTLPLELTQTLAPSLPKGQRWDIRYEAQPDHVLTWLVAEQPHP